MRQCCKTASWGLQLLPSYQTPQSVQNIISAMNEEGISGGAATDDDERNERFLTELRQKNDERRQTLHRLHDAYEEELQQWKKEQSVNNLHNRYNVARPPLEEHRIALEVEWQLLQETKEQEVVKTLVTIGSLFPQTNENDGPSQAVLRHCLM
jgi:hypothetical protein